MHLIGHQKNIDHLTRLAESSQLPHALLFTGPLGIGKKLVALHLAQTLFCQGRPKPCEKCLACRRVGAFREMPLQGHPDLIWIEPEKDLIKIDVIRSLKNTLALKPFEAPLKVAILVDAHCLNPAASNALLKTLEEPPENTLLILTTSSPHQLLKTILSRCQKVYFPPLTRAQTLDVLKQDGKEISPEIVEFSMGSPGLALSLKEEAFHLIQNTILPALNSQPKDLLKLFAAAEELADEDSYRQPALHLLRMKWREKLVLDPTPENLKKFDAIETAARALDQYANPLLTFENLFLNLCL